jgi:F0F1-type ATP synthase assembly protein I
MVTINCSAVSDSTLCNTLESAGAGLGVFLEYLTIALPTFLLLLAVIGIIVGIGFAVAYVIKSAMRNVKMK